MPRAYAEDVRRRVVADTDQGLSMRVVAEKYSVSPSFVSKLTRLWRREGSVASRQVGGYQRDARAEHADASRHHLAEQNGLTRGELRDGAQTALDVCAHLSSVDRFVRSLGYRYNKNGAGLRTRPR